MFRWATLALALATTALVSGCAGGGSKASGNTPTPTSGSARPGNGNPFGQILNDPQAKACLKAAGITLPTGTGRPSGFPTGGRPSDFPTGQRPSGLPTNFPTNFPSGQRPTGFPGGGQQFQAIQQALTACGITLSPPTGQPNG
jgi:hypothetical protein